MNDLEKLQLAHKREIDRLNADLAAEQKAHEETIIHLDAMTAGLNTARAELAARDAQYAELSDAAKSLYLSVYGAWGAFERALREEIGNTNYTCVAEKLARIDALVKGDGNGRD